MKTDKHLVGLGSSSSEMMNDTLLCAPCAPRHTSVEWCAHTPACATLCRAWSLGLPQVAPLVADQPPRRAVRRRHGGHHEHRMVSAIACLAMAPSPCWPARLHVLVPHIGRVCSPVGLRHSSLPRCVEQEG
jgi:hypothetical protein